MSIGPVQSYSPVIGGAPSDTLPPDPRLRQQQPAAADSSATLPPSVGTVPKQESRAPEHAPAQSQMPEDEVELQRDSELQNELIVRYVDGAGNLILQVPAEQVLNLQRAIAREFEQPKPRGTSEDLSQKGETHGH